MIDTVKNSIMGRLYLSKEENKEVFINNSELLHQHQVEGLRFLFSQYHKKKPGVIVNYPSRCGKTVMVILFVQAMRALLNKPVLILCMQDEEMSYWKNNFLQWTEYTDDEIATESSNPYVKNKKVFIKKLTDLKSYLRRSWSVIIVKNDIVSKDIARLAFDADFKIWLTSTDMLKDLSMLSFVYTWIYPKMKINIEEFQPINDSIKEKVKKLILLESFLESIVFRKHDMKVIAAQNKGNKISRKNKDASGTKIKRSKIKLIDDATVSRASNTTETSFRHDVVRFTPCDDDKEEEEFPINKKLTINLKSIDNSITNMGVDESIANDTSIETIKIDQCNHDIILHDQEKENDSESLMNFDSALGDLIQCENINITQNRNVNENTDMAEQGDKKLSENKISFKDNEVDIKNGLNNISENILEVGNDVNSLIKVDSSERIMPGSEVINYVNDSDVTPELLFSYNEVTAKNVPKIEKNAATSEVPSKGIKVQSSENRHKDIDAKLKELEESTLMQFKGSILDSIF